MKKWLIISLLISFSMSQAQDDPLLPTYKYEIQYQDIGNQITMAYVDEGPGDGEIVLMVHGLGGYIKNWYPTIDELSKTHRCIAIDLPGYGLSSIRSFDHEDYMEFFANSVMKFADELGLEEVNLLGHSMGGQVSIVIALKNPSWLKKLILAAPAGLETFTQEEGKILKGSTTAALLQTHNEEQIRAAYQINFVKIPPMAEEMIQERIKAKQAKWFPDYAFVREMGVRGMLDHPVREQLDQISVPAMVVFGEQDLLIPNRYFHPDLTTEDVANIGETIPNAKIQLLDAAGHMLQIDNPEAFNQSIKEFIQTN